MGEERMETENSEGIELLSYDPFVVLLDVLKHWFIVLMVALLAGMGSFVATELRYTPQYTTHTTFVVSTQSSTSTVYQNLSAATNLASVFSEVLNSSVMRQTVLEAQGLSGFDGSISTQAIPETNLLTMTVTGSDPRAAFLVTRAVIENHQVVSKQILGETVLDVLQEPSVPMAPSNPVNPRGNMKKAMVLSAAAMCVLLGVMSVMRDTVRSRQEAEKKLDDRILGELHHERKSKSIKMLFRKNRESILITNPTTSFSYVERIRQLRRQVEQHMPADGKVIMVTSVLENEGKSTVAANLALSFAQKRKKVLLIDGDLRQPACYKVLNQDCKVGVCDVLAGKRKLMEAVAEYKGMNRLSLLLEDRERRDASDLVISTPAAQLLEEAREHFDYIIVDTPPMSAGSDAEGLAELVDASVLVVRQNTASTASLSEALDILHRAKSKLLGCVLNNVYSSVLSDMNSYGYGYGHSYGYGHYGHYGQYGHYGAYHSPEQGREKVGVRHDK